jgi:hypothetical protein
MKIGCRWAWSALVVMNIGGAADLDGTQLISCLPAHGHDCMPEAKSCTALKPEKGKDLHLVFDVEHKAVKSPYRTSLLPIQTVTNNAESLVLQGTTLQLVWSATIHRGTGRLTIAIADREGAYVVFGQCQNTSAATAPKT